MAAMIPVELFTEIIDQMAPDSSLTTSDTRSQPSFDLMSKESIHNLDNCSLVNRFWAQKCRPKIFRVVPLRSAQDTRELETIVKAHYYTGSVIAKSIQQFVIPELDHSDLHIPWLHRLSLLYKMLPNCRPYHIRFRGAVGPGDTPRSLHINLPRFIPSLHSYMLATLSLHDVQFRAFNDLVYLLDDLHYLTRFHRGGPSEKKTADFLPSHLDHRNLFWLLSTYRAPGDVRPLEMTEYLCTLLMGMSEFLNTTLVADCHAHRMRQVRKGEYLCMWSVASHEKTRSCHFSPSICYASSPAFAGIVLVVDLSGDCAVTFEHVVRGDWGRFRQLCTDFPGHSRIIFQLANIQQHMFASEVGPWLSEMEDVEYVVAPWGVSSNSEANDLGYNVIQFSETVKLERGLPSVVYSHPSNGRPTLEIQVQGLRAGTAEEEERADVKLETLQVDEDGVSLHGTVRVRNIAYQKSVAARFAFGSWGTTYEVLASYVEGLPGGTHDRFSFKIDMTNHTDRHTMFLVVRYHSAGRAMWDNNNGANYSVSFAWQGRRDAIYALEGSRIGSPHDTRPEENHESMDARALPFDSLHRAAHKTLAHEGSRTGEEESLRTFLNQFSFLTESDPPQKFELNPILPSDQRSVKTSSSRAPSERRERGYRQVLHKMEMSYRKFARLGMAALPMSTQSTRRSR